MVHTTQGDGVPDGPGAARRRPRPTARIHAAAAEAPRERGNEGVIRILTACLVVFVAACGGGGGGGDGDGDTHPLFDHLFPLAATTIGTILTYDIDKTVRHGIAVSLRSYSRSFETDRQVDPSGPDLEFAGFPGDAMGGAAFMRTSRGLELTALAMTTFWGVDGICVTATSPGLLIAPASIQPGESHTCNLVASEVAQLTLTWVGPQAATGHPDAHRIDFVALGPYSNGDVSSPRFGATEFVVSGTILLVPDLGPVEGTIVHAFRDDTTVFEERQYDFELASVTPGP